MRAADVLADERIYRELLAEGAPRAAPPAEGAPTSGLPADPVSIAEAARMLTESPTMTRKRVEQGQLHGYRVGARTFLDRGEVSTFQKPTRGEHVRDAAAGAITARRPADGVAESLEAMTAELQRIADDVRGLRRLLLARLAP
jgi:hypothetical protein